MNIPTNKHKIIKIVKQITNVEVPTYDDLERVKDMFRNHINTGFSAEDINNYYSLGYNKNNFAAVLRNCFGLTLKTRKEAVINYCNKVGTTLTLEKKKYYRDCSFNIKEFDPRTPGFELLSRYKFLRGQNQKSVEHLNRDHMISKKYGWENKIDSKIISHPANCQLLLASDNKSKNTNCSITFDDLLLRISNW